MAPPPLKIQVKNTVYNTPILNEDMDIIAQQIDAKKQEIESLKHHLNGAVNELENLSNQFIALYIQQTGTFP